MKIEDNLKKIKEYRQNLQIIYDSGVKSKYYTAIIKGNSKRKTKVLGEQETALTDNDKIKILREMEKLDNRISFIENLNEE